MDSSRIDATVFGQFQKLLSKGSLSHAYLFTGDLTSFDLALYLAQACFCDNKSQGIPCQECRSCQQVANQTFADLVIVRPEGTVIKTQAIREMMGKASTSGLEGRAQFFIVKEADKLHPNAANAMLKMMEEPPGRFYLVLLSRDADKVLPTIKSRCQCFYFPKNTGYWQEALVAGGVSLSQAALLAQVISSQEELDDCLAWPQLSNMMTQTQKLLEAVLRKDPLALLLSAQLAGLVNERARQGFVFDLIMLLLVKKGVKDAFYVTRIIKAQQLWRANVPFQSALDYFVLP